ncbi:hypothetical protein FHS81_001945 [Pseudochelatococcus contaminans]|uniref:Uncharacterized protein n=1 Tax=Pseudochelatococcus contaminans TaxID=1538103 RepID=A0A7W6EHL1_9HYPH|nr:hypothetical protein [Pseudochelatococcus contaminans]
MVTLLAESARRSRGFEALFQIFVDSSGQEN